MGVIRWFCPSLLAACAVPQGGGDVGQPLYDAVPSITDIDGTCSVDAQTWTFDVTTNAWTANGNLYLAADTLYLERHPLTSIEAAADGTADHLQAQVAIQADWRDASPGSATAFQCNPSTWETLNFRVVVYTPGTSDVGDCRSWGPAPSNFDSFSSVPPCDLAWEPDTGGDTGA